MNNYYYYYFDYFDYFNIIYYCIIIFKFIKKHILFLSYKYFIVF